MSRNTTDAVSIAATLSMRRAEEASLGGDRIGLREAIDRLGSITRAAREVGVSYKTAWDTIDAMNIVAERPLVRRMTSGLGGGGTVLIDEGKEAIGLYRVLQVEHQRFLKFLEGNLGDVEHFYSLVKRVEMRVSTRNLLCGTVDRIVSGPLNAEVTVALPGGSVLTAIVTNESAKRLSLAKGDHACALVKASSVILGVDH